MRRYDDHVEVRTEEAGARLPGAGTVPAVEPVRSRPTQFLWHGQLWQVRDVLAHWIETTEWWRGDRARAVAGTDSHAPAYVPADVSGAPVAHPFSGLLSEREVWRVEARRPEIGAGAERVVRAGVFDLAHDHAADRWQLVSCSD